MSRNKHHPLEYLEKLIGDAPQGVTIAGVASMFGIGTREATKCLRELEDQGRITMREEDRVMIFRKKGT